MRYIIFKPIGNGEKKNMVSHYYNPSTLVAPHAFVLAPAETVMILLETNDLVYHFRGCCRSLHEMANEQICMAVRNMSPVIDEFIVVSRDTRLDELMEMPRIDHRLVYADINELSAMVRHQNKMINNILVVNCCDD